MCSSRDVQVHVCGSVNGTIMPRLLRAKLSYPIRCTQVACGRKHIVALGENGFVLSWGTGGSCVSDPFSNMFSYLFV